MSEQNLISIDERLRRIEALVETPAGRTRLVTHETKIFAHRQRVEIAPQASASVYCRPSTGMLASLFVVPVSKFDPGLLRVADVLSGNCSMFPCVQEVPFPHVATLAPWFGWPSRSGLDFALQLVNRDAAVAELDIGFAFAVADEQGQDWDPRVNPIRVERTVLSALLSSGSDSSTARTKSPQYGARAVGVLFDQKAVGGYVEQGSRRLSVMPRADGGLVASIGLRHDGLATGFEVACGQPVLVEADRTDGWVSLLLDEIKW